jgi:4-alpha-glucanotransferase
VPPTAGLDERSSGILLHPTSLPGGHGFGDLGAAARAFADYLAAAGQTWWQMLPVVPPGYSGSPYDSPSAFAGSPWLVSLCELERDGLLTRADVEPQLPAGAGFEAAQRFREERLRRAHAAARSRRSTTDADELADLRRSCPWLADWSLFSALGQRHGGGWCGWPAGIRRRDPQALREASASLREEVDYHDHVQLWFRRQWRALRAHCRSRNVALLGDVPMFVAHDSADVWSHPEAFFLDDSGQSTVVAGVPPDAFSETGQLWGNPLYRWDQMRAQGFDWWLSRLGTTLERFDAARLDHFIAFRRYWEIAAGASDARVGRFVQVPGEAFFERVRSALGGLPFIAEDLGIVTPEVHALRDEFALPGMRVLQFAFGGDEPNDYQPHRFVRNTVVYTGTHDNDTTAGWFSKCSEAERTRALRYVGSTGEEPHWDLLRTAAGSVANLAVFPIQDALGLGSEARMNTPATVEGNWAYRVLAEQLTPALADRLRAVCGLYERTPRWHDGNRNAFV